MIRYHPSGDFHSSRASGRAETLVHFGTLLGLAAEQTNQIVVRFKALASMTSSLTNEASVLAAIVAHARLHGPRDRHDVGITEWMPVFDESGAHASPVNPWRSRGVDQGIPDANGHRERIAIWRTCLMKLPFEHRAQLVLADGLRLSPAEVSAATGHSTPACRDMLHQARQAFRAMLAPHMSVGSDSHLG